MRFYNDAAERMRALPRVGAVSAVTICRSTLAAGTWVEFAGRPKRDPAKNC